MPPHGAMPPPPGSVPQPGPHPGEMGMPPGNATFFSSSKGMIDLVSVFQLRGLTNSIFLFQLRQQATACTTGYLRLILLAQVAPLRLPVLLSQIRLPQNLPRSKIWTMISTMRTRKTTKETPAQIKTSSTCPCCFPELNSSLLKR